MNAVKCTWAETGFLCAGLVAKAVFNILAMGVPTQIIKAIVGFGCIWEMASLTSRRTCANKGQQNERVNFHGDHLSIDSQRHLTVSTGVRRMFHGARRSDPARSTVIPSLAKQRPDSAVISREITKEAGNGFQFSHTYILPKPTEVGK